MSPSRPAPRGYRAPRRRHEVIVAALGVAVVLAVAVALIWVLAPHEDEPIDPSTVIPPIAVTTTTSPTAASTSTSTPPG